jgi:hypothetical protein
MAETYVQVAADGAGKKIRNLSVQTLDSTGTLQTTYMQVVSLADENGNQILGGDQNDFQQQLLDEVRAIRMGIQQLLDAGGRKADINDLLEQAREYSLNQEN